MDSFMQFHIITFGIWFMWIIALEAFVLHQFITGLLK